MTIYLDMRTPRMYVYSAMGDWDIQPYLVDSW